ncbi:hypothetical protein BDW68DRAFT_152664 [Aspergillus falconensis]
MSGLLLLAGLGHPISLRGLGLFASAMTMPTMPVSLPTRKCLGCIPSLTLNDQELRNKTSRVPFCRLVCSPHAMIVLWQTQG